MRRSIGLSAYASRVLVVALTVWAVLRQNPEHSDGLSPGRDKGGTGVPVSRQSRAELESSVSTDRQTPTFDPTWAERDLYIDFLRVASMILVTFGHWFIARIWWSGGRVGVRSGLHEVPELSVATWIFMAVPVFFFVGGFSNAVVFRRVSSAGGATRDFYRRRLVRLLPPTSLFLGVWSAVQVVMHLTGSGGQHLIRGVSPRGTLPFGPLWFLGVYLGVIALCPLMYRLHIRHRVRVPFAIGLGVVAIDLLRSQGIAPAVWWLNVALVWLLPHQLGFFYADGSLPSGPRKVPVVLFVGGIASLLFLVSLGRYPNAVGASYRNAPSNLRPPTLCMVALVLWQVGFVMLVKTYVLGRLLGPRTSAIVARLNAITITIFLWHMTAFLVAALILVPLGAGEPGESTAAWWAQRPVWLVLPSALLIAIAMVVGPAERLKRSAAGASTI